MHKTDLLIAANKPNAHYFISSDETRFLRGIFSIAAHRLKFLCTLHKKIEIMCIAMRQIHRFPGSPVPEVKRLFGLTGSRHVQTSRFRIQSDAG
jgi:hypothetical protein